MMPRRFVSYHPLVQVWQALVSKLRMNFCQIAVTAKSYPNLIALSGNTLITFKPLPILSDFV
jgi:hypothetical protein